MEPINVCQFSTMTAWAGVEKMLADLLFHPGHAKIRHVLISTSSKPEIIQEIRQQGTLCYQPEGSFRYDPRKITKMAHWMRSHSINLVHSYNAHANSWANLATIIAGIPILVTGEHGSIWNVRPPIAWLDRWAQHRSKLTIANSKATAKLLQMRYRVPEKKIRVVYNGVAESPNRVEPNQIRESLGLSTDKLIVGSVGRLDTPKDFATFIETCAMISKKRKDVVFVLVGGGILERELRELVAAFGLQDRFLMTGQRPDARSLIKIFDVFVSTSIRESFGNVLVEAALNEKTVIAPKIDGIPEVVVDGETGILLTPTKPVRRYRTSGTVPIPKKVFVNGKFQSPKSLDPQALAEQALRILDERCLREQFGEQARARAKKFFSIKRYSNDLQQLYMELLGRRENGADWVEEE